MTWILDFAATTVSVMMFSILGVMGSIDGVEPSPYGYTVATKAMGWGISLPPFAYYKPGSDFLKYHEEGHMIQHQRLKEWYWVGVGIVSAVGHHTGYYLWDSEREPNTHAWKEIGL